jgi:hypothetical protein
MARKNSDSIWDGCREALDAAAEHKAQEADRLKSAALKLGGFTLNEKGNRWVTHCPHCGGKVELYTEPGGVCVVGYNRECAAVPRIRQWLCDNGFQS